MQNGWPYTFRRAIKVIPGNRIDQKKAWSCVQERLHPVSQNEYSRQIAYRIVANAQGFDVRETTESLAMDLEKLSLTVIARFAVDPSIQAYYRVLSAYCDEICQKIGKAEQAITIMYTIERSGGASFIQSELIEPMREAIDAVNGEVGALKAKVGALAKTKEEAKAMSNGLNLGTTVANGQQVEQVSIPSMEGVKGAHVKVVEMAENSNKQMNIRLEVLKELWSTTELARKAQEVIDAKNAIYATIRTKLHQDPNFNTQSCEDKDLFKELDIYAQKSGKRTEIVSRYQYHVLSIFALAILLSVVAALLYYAYETHIKPLHFGLMTAVVSASVLLLAFKGVREYQQIVVDAKLETSRPAAVAPPSEGYSSYYSLGHIFSGSNS